MTESRLGGAKWGMQGEALAVAVTFIYFPFLLDMSLVQTPALCVRDLLTGMHGVSGVQCLPLA